MTRRAAALQFVVLVLIVCGAALWLLLRQSGGVSKPELKIALVELRSQAVHAILLAETALAGSATSSYYSAQLALLQEKTRGTTDAITRHRAAAGAEDLQRSTVALAGRVQQELNRLQRAYGDRATLQALRSDFAAIAPQLMQLEAGATTDR